ncbi:alanine/glycine:cation symporter family protein [Jejuia spongiicola]|uniref:Alanine:cation symporter family protein n=1 Tax=Jejuia spongiicola TaxID=2942207 RepID=A0ABT0QIQ5_9FLAO|nr:MULTISPECIES: alanine/glycine:cation symporter family protein [Flavobacteriaceae]MCL6296523.1 alanine:cation symporter family protein [Jejuia spongiicola]PIA82270.1 alanine glycine permease [Gaetbulibacter sp. 4G1]
MKKYLLSIFTLILPFLTFAQEAEKGLDERVNDAFMPVATWWEGFVLTTIPIGEYNVPFVVILLVAGATFFTVYFRFPSVTKFGLAINTVRGKYDEIDHHEAIDGADDEAGLAVDGDVIGTIKDESQEGEVSHFQALATAVSGTVGLGNIAGVAVAIALGGPGATFWMIVCGLIGMATKFVECTLGVKYRDVGDDGTVYGGPMYYLSKGLKERGFAGIGKVLAALFAILCVGASFGGGNAFQSNQAAVQLSSLFGLQGGATGLIIGFILAVLVGIVIIGGIKRIAKITEKIVPFMAGIYVLAALVIIFANINYVGKAFGLIFEGAFTPMAGLGGLVGVLIVGFQRAAFSNEAGAGSAAIAHSAVKTKYPASEGVVALLEPFIDTVVICTMTALVIIFFNIDGTNMQSVFQYGAAGDSSSSVLLNVDGSSVGGVDLTSMAFDSVIPGFSYILTIAIVLFAFSTMISWSYYGLQSWKYLFGKGKRADMVYKILFLLFVIIGAAATLDAVIKFSDAMILALVFPNMIGLFFLFPKVREEMSKYVGAIKSSKE